MHEDEFSLQPGGGIVPTYFRFEVEEFDEAGKPAMSHYGLPKAAVRRFRGIALPHFLEGTTRLKIVDNAEEARAIYPGESFADLPLTTSLTSASSWVPATCSEFCLRILRSYPRERCTRLLLSGALPRAK